MWSASRTPMIFSSTYRRRAGAELGFLLILIQACKTYTSGETLEYCWPNDFNATCDPGEVIVMTKARYGRMHQGKCLTSELHIGCYADVLGEVDKRCSGLQHCIIKIPDPVLHEIQPCPPDMLAYMEASYDCRKAIVPSFLPCDSHEPERLTAPSGFISSAALVTEGVNRPYKCSWTVHAEKGQHINVTLYDMSIMIGRRDSSGVCLVYAIIREHRDASEITVCRGTQRMRNLFLSEKNKVEIQVFVDPSTASEGRFLLKYEVVGCANPPLPKDAWSRRSGDKITVSCNHTGETWYLYCSDSKWIGPQRNCTAPSPTPEFGHHKHPVFPYILIGIFMGVLIGIALLVSVLICERRRRTKRQKEITNNPSETERLHSADITRGQQDIKLQTHHDPYAAYTHVWELRNVKNQNENNAANVQGQNQHHTCLYKDPALFCEHTFKCPQHMYESPSKRAQHRQSREGTSVQKTSDGGTYVPNYEAQIHDQIQSQGVLEVDLVPTVTVASQ